MVDQIVYLDTSAIIKRYVEEPGTDLMRNLYRKVYVGELKLSFNIWNIGEVLGVLDRARSIERVSKEDYISVRRRFLLETMRLVRLRLIILIHVKSSILEQSWKIIEKYHIYQADALQIASAKNIKAAQFLVADKKLHEIASEEGLNSIYLG